MKRVLYIILVICCASLPQSTNASDDGKKLLMKCGSVRGYSYPFSETVNPESDWLIDAIDESYFNLFKLPTGDFDIEFNDKSGSRSYNSEGVKLIEIVNDDRYIMLGAFSFGQNATIYTFDLIRRKLAFTVNSAYFIEKVGAFSVNCE